MRVISSKYIREFIKMHPDSSVALREWHNKIKRSKPTCFNDLRKKFSGVDYVGNKRFVFNIKGKKYRIVALILFGPQKTCIRYIGTYADYCNISCKEI